MPEMNPSEPWVLLQQIAEKADPKITKAFLDTVMQVKNGFTRRRYERLLSQYDFEKVLEETNWKVIAETELEPKVAQTLRDVVESAAQSTVLPIQGEIVWDILDPRAVEWVRNESSTLITNINNETMQAVRETIQRGFTEGKSVQQMAEGIRDIVGMNTRQAGAFDKYAADLVKRDLSPTRLETLLGAKERQLIKQRALLISRTETIKAANEGWRMGIQKAVEDDLLDPNVWEIAWITTRDERKCDKCNSMIGKRRPLVGLYSKGAYAGRNGPPGHPGCRCAERTVRKSDKTKNITAEPEPVKIKPRAKPASYTNTDRARAASKKTMNSLTKNQRNAYRDYTQATVLDPNQAQIIGREYANEIQAAKNAIRDHVRKRCPIFEEVAKEWQGSPQSPMATAFKIRAAEVEGIPVNSLPRFNFSSAYQSQLDKALTKISKKDYIEIRELSSEILKSQGLKPDDTITVFRGIGGDKAKPFVAELKKAVESGSSFNVNEQALYSTTKSTGVADFFGKNLSSGATIKYDIPISEIKVSEDLLSLMSGDMANQGEMLVLKSNKKLTKGNIRFAGEKSFAQEKFKRVTAPATIEEPIPENDIFSIFED